MAACSTHPVTVDKLKKMDGWISFFCSTHITSDCLFKNCLGLRTDMTLPGRSCSPIVRFYIQGLSSGRNRINCIHVISADTAVLSWVRSLTHSTYHHTLPQPMWKHCLHLHPDNSALATYLFNITTIIFCFI